MAEPEQAVTIDQAQDGALAEGEDHPRLLRQGKKQPYVAPVVLAAFKVESALAVGRGRGWPVPPEP